MSELESYPISEYRCVIRFVVYNNFLNNLKMDQAADIINEENQDDQNYGRSEQLMDEEEIDSKICGELSK